MRHGCQPPCTKDSLYPRGQSRAHPRRRGRRVRRRRIRGRAHRSHRPPHAPQRADDLLPLRLEEGRLPRRPREHLRADERASSRSSPPSAPQPHAGGASARYVDLLTEHPRFADVLVRELLDGAKHLKALWKERPELFKQHPPARARDPRAGHRRRRARAARSGADGDDADVDHLLSDGGAPFARALPRSEARAEPDAWKAHLRRCSLDGIRAR